MKYNNIDIVFVDDNMDDATLTLRALRKGGLSNTIIHLKDGAEALSFMYAQDEFSSRNKSQHPKLILLDLKMPKVSGLEVLEKLKTDADFKTIPIVILTSSKEDPDVKKCYELGANSYIVKPVESENFFSAIKELGFFWMILNHPAK
ncbi:response regulator [Flavobacterium pedocola]